MRTLISIIGALGLLAAGESTAFAQLATPNTTFSVAIAPQSGNSGGGVNPQWCLASATGVVLPSLAAGTGGSYLFSDKEAAVVTAQGASATCFVVKRGQLGTSSGYGHSTAAKVWVGNVATGTGDTSRPFAGGVLTANVPSGSCTSSAQYSLPVIIYGPNNSDFSGGTAYCVAGYWSVSTLGEGQAPVTNVQPFTAFTTLSNSIAGVSVTDVAGTIWFSQLQIPNSATLTGACVLNGATVGTDKWIVALYDASGVLVANSATAGTTTAGVSLYQCIAFTATASVVGPATYYLALQGNGTTDNFSAYKTGGAPTNYGTQSQAGVFGTLAAMTTPTVTFTTAKGPIGMVF